MPGLGREGSSHALGQKGEQEVTLAAPGTASQPQRLLRCREGSASPAQVLQPHRHRGHWTFGHLRWPRWPRGASEESQARQRIPAAPSCRFQGWVLVAQRIYGLLLGPGDVPCPLSWIHISPCSQQALPWADFVFVALGVTPGRDLAVRAERGWGISGSRAVRCPAGQAAALGGFQHADSVWVCAGVHFQNQIPAP